MAVVITLEGIDKAISSLAYKNKKSLKYRVISAVRAYYFDDSSIEEMPPIDTDDLVKHLWETGEDDELIRKKRKNFNVIKSSINDDFKRLFESGRNVEGIAIGPGNQFVMSSEAKDKVLSRVGANLSELSQEAEIIEGLNDVIGTIKEMMDTVNSMGAGKDFDGPGILGKIKEVLQDISETIGQGVEGSGGEADTADIEIRDDDVVEIVEEELDEDVEMIDENELLEDVEVMEEEDVEILDEEELADNNEFLEDVEIQEEGEVEVVDEEDLADDNELLEDIEIMDEEDVEVFEEAEINDDLEILDEEALPETSLLADTEACEEGVLADEADVEVIDEEDLPEHIEEILDEDEILEDAELVDDEILDEADIVDFPDPSRDINELGSDLLNGPSLTDDEIEKNRILTENFEGYLSAREQFYNKYLFVPAGKHLIGSKNPKENEFPQKYVQLKEFYMGKFPVTNALFEVFVDETGYKTTAEILGYGNVYYGKVRKIVNERTGAVSLIASEGVGFKRCPGACWYLPAGPGSNLHHKRSHPVVQVSIEDARIFSAWIGKRLPTEAQWEAAMRTAKGYSYPWGDRFNSEACNIEENHIGDTSPVDEYLKFENQLGIADGIGNVYEWTRDDEKENSALTTSSRTYVVKGGCWLSDSSVRLSMRYKFEEKTTSNILGFRCVSN